MLNIKGFMMNCISICHSKSGNYQVEHTGIQHDCIASFDDWCNKNDVLWAHLFDQKNGHQIATYNNIQGLTTIVY